MAATGLPPYLAHFVDKPPIELNYASPLRQAAGPSGSRVLAGVVCILLGLVPVAVCLVMVWMGVFALFQVHASGAKGEPLPRTSAIGFAFAAILSGFSTFVMFRAAKRMFTTSKRRPLR